MCIADVSGTFRSLDEFCNRNAVHSAQRISSIQVRSMSLWIDLLGQPGRFSLKLLWSALLSGWFVTRDHVKTKQKLEVHCFESCPLRHMPHDVTDSTTFIPSVDRRFKAKQLRLQVCFHETVRKTMTNGTTCKHVIRSCTQKILRSAQLFAFPSQTNSHVQDSCETLRMPRNYFSLLDNLRTRVEI